MRTQRRVVALSTILFLCAILPSRSTFAADPSASDEAPSKFLRFVPDEHGGGTLQASTVRFVNADGVVVDLVAAIHIAEPSFFQALDESFAEYDAVLYELVAPSEMLVPATQGSSARVLRDPSASRPAGSRPTTRRRPQRSLAWVGGLQQGMKDALKLSFQLEGIDYRRPNFIHADLDAETFQDLQQERGESMFTIMLNAMLKEMSNPGAGAAGPGLGDILFAMRSPDRARSLKLLLARQFGKLDEQMAGLDGPNGSVILTERNKACLKVLRQQLAEGDKRNLAIFYGAAHLKGIEQVMTKELGFRQVGPPFWRVAWDMSTPRGGATTKSTTRQRGATVPVR